MYDEKHDFMLGQFDKVEALRGGRVSFDDVKKNAHIAGIKQLQFFNKGATTHHNHKNILKAKKPDAAKKPKDS
jgi:hypothetical protein